MTNGMKWFVVGFMALFFLMMGIFVMVSSQSPGIPNPTQEKVDAYVNCLKNSPSLFGPSDKQVQTCKDLTGQITP